MRWLVALVVGLMPLAALADRFPALYTVTGVADDDVLNVRSEPAASGAILATLPPDADDIEVLEVTGDGAWGWIGLPEGNGWVAMAFLIRQETDIGVIPRPLRCLGTEPFWSVSLGRSAQEFATPETVLPLTLASQAVADSGYLAFFSDAEGGLWTMTVGHRRCSDGMSDRTYGFAAQVFHQSRTGNRFLSGCCMLAGN